MANFFKYSKSIMLFLLLGMPIFLIFFLNYCSTSHYKLEKFPGKKPYLINEDGSPHIIRPFGLKDQNNQIFNLNVLKSKIFIADFIFTRCQTICPKMSSQLMRVQDVFSADTNIAIVSITVDPEHDSPDVLSDYARQHKAINNKWFFLTGSSDSILQIARQDFKIAAANAQTIDHSDKFVLVDTKGRIRGYYNGTDALQVDTLILETKVLKSENE